MDDLIEMKAEVSSINLFVQKMSGYEVCIKIYNKLNRFITE